MTTKDERDLKQRANIELVVSSNFDPQCMNLKELERIASEKAMTKEQCLAWLRGSPLDLQAGYARALAKKASRQQGSKVEKAQIQILNFDGGPTICKPKKPLWPQLNGTFGASPDPGASLKSIDAVEEKEFRRILVLCKDVVGSGGHQGNVEAECLWTYDWFLRNYVADKYTIVLILLDQDTADSHREKIEAGITKKREFYQIDPRFDFHIGSGEQLRHRLEELHQ